MDNTARSSGWKLYWPTKRRLIQLYSALLYNDQLKGFVTGSIYKGPTKNLCVPGLNCYSCPGAVGACPLGALQNALGSLDQRIGFYVLGILMLYGMLLGRTICGWLCPMGMLQELLYALPTPKIPKSRITRRLSYLKYVLLAVFAAAIPVYFGVIRSIPVPGFCKYICPAGTLEGAMGLLPNNPAFLSMLGIYFTRKFVIMCGIGLLCVFCFRSFCRFLCPLGAIYGMFSRLAVIGVKVDMQSCNGCGACVRGCKMDVCRVGDHECIHCGQCMAGCPAGAIAMKAGKVTLLSSSGANDDKSREQEAKRKRIGKAARWIALALLFAALLWYNVLAPSTKKSGSTASTPVPSAETRGSGAESGGRPGEGGSGQGAESSGRPGEGGSGQGAESSGRPGEGSGGSGAESGRSEAKSGAGQAADGSTRSEAPIGYEKGEQLADFSVQCLDGQSFHLADNRGKVVVINLWGTYCGPCVKELPYFEELCKKHPDDLAFIAVHSNLTDRDVGKFVAAQGWTFPIAVDGDDEEIYGIVNANGVLPQTIVLNRRGEVIYNVVGSVTPELLEKLYEQAAGE